MASKVGSGSGAQSTLEETGDLSKSSKSGGKEEKDKSSSGGASERPSSPDQVKCAICLGDVVNRCCSNSCTHQFCFTCLLEWSKVKPECPLCKSSFRAIYHNFRSTTEYDEYVVPTPAVPHLSIRFTASAASYRLSPFIRVLEARAAQLSPITGYEGVGLGGMYSHQNSITPLLMTSNPFSSSSGAAGHGHLRPEYFGEIVANELQNLEDLMLMRGYQNRRRRYDRNEWVQPFGSTLQPGSVIFPSVDYIRSHPSAGNRLRNWLFREMNVLLGIHRNRDQMSFIYDLIMHLLVHYDIRSRDFRSSISSYFGIRTAHFQHELYHFLLSGMGMEEYDRVAQYPSASSSSSSSAATASTSCRVAGASTSIIPPQQRNAQPEVITLDSDDEDRSSNNRRTLIRTRRLEESRPEADDVIVVESSDDEDSYPLLRPVRDDDSSTARRSFTTAAASAPPTHDIGGSRSYRSSTPIPESPEDEPEPFRLRARVFDDPEMPILEPEVYSFIPLDNYASSSASAADPRTSRVRENLTSAIDRSQAAAATMAVSASASNTNSPASPSPELISHTSQSFTRARTRPRRDSSSDRVRFMDAEFDLDLNVSVESYSSPPPSEFREREIHRNFLRDQDRTRSSYERRDPRSETQSGWRFLSNYTNNPSSSRTAEGGSAFVAYEPEGSHPSSREELSRPPRTSCIFEGNGSGPSSSFQQFSSTSSSSRGGRYRATSPSPAFRIDLYPHGMSSSQVMDLSRSAGLISTSSGSSRPGPSSSMMDRTGRPPCPPPPSLTLSPLNYSTIAASASSKKEEPSTPKLPEDSDQSESDELECLGSFPIQKKPPLAVITLSSDDEDERRVKAEKNDILNALSSDEEANLLDGFMDWGSQSEPPEFNLLVPTPPPAEGDTYRNSHSSSSSEYLHESSLVIAPGSTRTLASSAIPSTSTSTTTTRSKRLMPELQPTTSKRRLVEPEPPKDSSKSRKYHHHSVASLLVTPPPKKRSKRLQILSTSEEDSNDGSAASMEAHSSQTTSTAAKALTVPKIRIPKKRMFVELPSTPPSQTLSSSEDSISSSDEEDELDTSSSSKNRSTSSSSKKHRSKSKKSKKSKKHKHKQRRKHSSSKSDKSPKTPPDAVVEGGSGKAKTGKGASSTSSKHSSSSKPKEGSRTSSRLMSASSRPTPVNLEEDDDDLRIPSTHPESLGAESDHPASSATLSTVDPSGIFNSAWFTM